MNKLKEVLMLLALFVMVIVGMLYMFKVADTCWENRAKAAGYYDSLPDSLKNPKDIQK